MRQHEQGEPQSAADFSCCHARTRHVGRHDFDYFFREPIGQREHDTRTNPGRGRSPESEQRFLIVCARVWHLHDNPWWLPRRAACKKASVLQRRRPWPCRRCNRDTPVRQLPALVRHRWLLRYPARRPVRRASVKTRRTAKCLTPAAAPLPDQSLLVTSSATPSRLGGFRTQGHILIFLFPSFSPQMILAFLLARGGLITARERGIGALEIP